MKKLAGAFLAIGIVATACGDDGNSAGATPGAAGASGDGTGATETDAGQGPVTSGGSPGSSGSASPSGGEGGTQSRPDAQGGNASGGEPDQSVSLGGAFEEVHGDPPIDPDCGDYSERHDRSNGSKYWGPDLTEILLDKTAVTICGRLDAYHFEPNTLGGYGTVDADFFRINVAGDADYQVSIEFPEDAPPADRTVIMNDPGISNTRVGLVDGTRGAVWARLYEGFSFILVESTSLTAIDHSIPYKLHIRKDEPVSRCPTVKPVDADQSYVEAHDDPASAGNDVVRYALSGSQTPTTVSDAPEPSNVVLNVSDHSLVQGNSALVDYGEAYADADMYAFQTGTSDVLTLRLDWPKNEGTDLDLFLFNADDLTFRYLAAQLNYPTNDPELLTTLVTPNTSYWLYVAGSSDSETGGLPAAYGVTMCGEKLKF